MRKFHVFSVIIMLFSNLAGLFYDMPVSYAQEDLIKVNVQVALEMNGEPGVDQPQISYDIINYPVPGGEGEIIFSYRSQEPESQRDLYLAPGEYKFRLFDGGNFYREDVRITGRQVSMTKPTLNETDQAQGVTDYDLDNVGQVVQWGDGTEVYDFMFQVETGDNLWNPATNQYETDLKIILADPISIESALREDQTTPPEESSVSETTTQETTTQETTTQETTTQEFGQAILAVINSNGELMASVLVTINEETFMTDPYGQVIFNDIAPGTYTYTVQVPDGYQFVETKEFTVYPNMLTELSETIVPVAEETTPETNLGTITARLLSPEGTPVEGATIRVNNQDQLTDAQGQTQFNNLTVGETYAIEVVNILDTGTSYQPIQPVQVIVTQEDQVIDFELVVAQATGDLLVEVSNLNGELLNGVDVTIADQVVTTDSLGQAYFEDLNVQTHSYEVTNVPEGYEAEESGTVLVFRDQVATLNIYLEEAQQTADLLVEVSNEAGELMSGIEIAVGSQVATTDNSGQAVFSDMNVQTYNYEVNNIPEGYQAVEPGTVEVTKDQEATLRIILEEAIEYGTVTFQVRDQGDAPVHPATIQFNNQSYSTNSEGNIIILEVQADETYNYQLESLPEGYQGQISGTVRVEAGENAPVRIEAQRPVENGRILITVVDQDGQTVPGVQVALGDNLLTTDSNGNVAFNDLSPSDYTYSVNQVPDNYSGQPSATHTLSEGEEAQLQLVIERELQPAQLTINVNDQDGQGVAGVVVEVGNRQESTNDKGSVSFTDLEPGEYSYRVVEVPENYEISGEGGSIYLNHEVSETRQLQVLRQIQPGELQLAVLDQASTPVENVTIRINNQEYTTNTEGTIHVQGLAVGDYQLQLVELPTNYQTSQEDLSFTITEGETTNYQLDLTYQEPLGNFVLVVQDNQGQAVPGVDVKLGEATQTTDSDGRVSFNELPIGSISYEIVSIPEDYRLEERVYQVEIVDGQTQESRLELVKVEETTTTTTTTEEPTTTTTTEESTTTTTTTVEPTTVESTTQETTVEATATPTTVETTTSSPNVVVQVGDVSIEPAATLSSEESSRIEAEARQATREFVDAETGIRVFVNPADAGDIVRLSARKVNNLDSVETLDSDVYELQLLNRQNQPVELTHIAEVKLPTRPVTSQLKVLRINNDELSSLIFGLHNRQVTFRTQSLGTFGVIYGGSASALESAESSVQEETTVANSELPNSGESSTIIITIVAIGILVAGGFLLFNRKKSGKDE